MITNEVEPTYMLSKKSQAVDYRLKDEYFVVARDESIYLLLRDLHVFAQQNGLTNRERSLISMKTLKGAAKEHFLNHINTDTTYSGIVDNI